MRQLTAEEATLEIARYRGAIGVYTWDMPMAHMIGVIAGISDSQQIILEDCVTTTSCGSSEPRRGFVPLLFGDVVATDDRGGVTYTWNTPRGNKFCACTLDVRLGQRV